MKYYMLFNPLDGAPWDYPAMKKKDLIINLSDVRYVSNLNIELSNNENEEIQKQKKSLRGIEIKCHPKIEDEYLISICSLEGKDSIWFPIAEFL